MNQRTPPTPSTPPSPAPRGHSTPPAATAPTPTPHTSTATPSGESLLGLAPAEVFKEDARSRVWRVDAPDGRAWVIKHFVHAPWKQKLTARLGTHPAQREQQWHQRLAQNGLAVAPIEHEGVYPDGTRWLATPYLGVSLYNWLRHCDPQRDARQRHDLTRQLGRLTGLLLAMRVQHGDHKASNVVLDDAGVLHLIDAGACRGFKGTPLLGAALPMLLNLHANLRDAATYHTDPAAVTPTRSDRLRFYRAMLAGWKTMPDGLQHLPRHREFL